MSIDEIHCKDAGTGFMMIASIKSTYFVHPSRLTLHRTNKPWKHPHVFTVVPGSTHIQIEVQEHFTRTVHQFENDLDSLLRPRRIERNSLRVADNEEGGPGRQVAFVDFLDVSNFGIGLFHVESIDVEVDIGGNPFFGFTDVCIVCVCVGHLGREECAKDEPARYKDIVPVEATQDVVSHDIPARFESLDGGLEVYSRFPFFTKNGEARQG